MACKVPPEHGLTGDHTSNAEGIPGGLVRISGPLRDRHERPGGGQHRAQGQTQDRCQPVTHARRAGMGTAASTGSSRRPSQPRTGRRRSTGQ